MGAGQHALRLLTRRTRLLTFLEPSCWPKCTEDGRGRSRMCHRGFVSVRVEELAALSVLRFELVIIEVVHQVLGPASHQPASAGFPWSSRRPSCSSTLLVLLKVAGGLLPELCIHSDVWLHPRVLVKPEGAMDFGQTYAQRRV